MGMIYENRHKMNIQIEKNDIYILFWNVHLFMKAMPRDKDADTIRVNKELNTY